MKYKDGFKQSFLLTSDVHFDSKACLRNLYFSHLDRAKEIGAGVFCFGDFFDIMGARIDRRSTKDLIREEYNTGDYFGSVIRDAVEKLEPYLPNLVLFSDGNHETAVLKKMEFDPLEMLCERLNDRGGNVFHGPYLGFIRFVFDHESRGRVRTKILGYDHGLWGGIISKGSQGVPRYAAIMPDCDLIVCGHTHDVWMIEQPRYRLKQNGEIKVEPQLHLKTPTYKEEFGKGKGWAVEKIKMPKSVGGWWLHFEYGNRKIKMRVERAK